VNQHIDINNRMLDLLKKLMGSTQSDFAAKFADRVSTLQVERGQRWSDLVPAIALVLGQLIDMRPTDDKGDFLPDTKANREKGMTMRLAITKNQKQELLDWTNEHFPEFNNVPEKQWLPQASAARAYIDFLTHGRKCSDE
jgi:hypothetical protein